MPDIILAIDSALKKNNQPTHPEDRYPSFVGSGLREAARRALPEGKRKDEELIDRVYNDIQSAYRQKPVVGSALYPGVGAMVQELKSRGLKLAVITNKDRDIAQVVVDTLFPDKPFDILVGVDENTPPKPDPAGVMHALATLNLQPRQLVMVGDSEVDLKTGLRAGFPVIAVSWGFRPVETLKAAGAEIIADSVSSIISLVEEYHG